MTEKSQNTKKTPPLKKGGTRFPRYSLEQVIPWTKRLVSKTHLSPQPRDIIDAGVLESRGSTADVKISTIKQFGLIQGNNSGYEATPLAKSLINSPEEDKESFLRTAALHPHIFKSIFDAFQGDEVNLSRIRLRATDLNVHPDSADSCVAVYISSLCYAGLISENGEKFSHLLASKAIDIATDTTDETIDSPATPEEEVEIIDDDTMSNLDNNINTISEQKAIFHVNVNLDASLDTEKLEKHLKLLKQYGAI